MKALLGASWALCNFAKVRPVCAVAECSVQVHRDDPPRLPHGGRGPRLLRRHHDVLAPRGLEGEAEEEMLGVKEEETRTVNGISTESTLHMLLLPIQALDGGKRVGIVGIGGLGQFGVQLAKAMGNKVTAISTSPSKEAAAREIGADSFVVSTSAESMAGAAGSLDLILNTVAANHDINTYLPLLAPKGVIVQLGLALAPHSISQVRWG